MTRSLGGSWRTIGVQETSPRPWSPGEKALDALADRTTAIEVAGVR
jgi:hypothetical protein